MGNTGISLVVHTAYNKIFVEGQIDVGRNINDILLVTIKDFLRFPILVIMLLDVDGFQFVVHPFSKTESFDHRVFVNASYGCHGLGVLFHL